MNDLISRRQAIDAIDELHDKPNAWLDLAVDALEKLPSAQPEIIYCKDCKHYHTDVFGGELGASGIWKKYNCCTQCL